jgi:PAS domain S-box-containing protein
MRTAAQNHTYKSADNRPKSGTLVNTLISRVTYFLALAAIVISLIIGLLYYGIVFRQTVDLMEGMFTVLSPPLRSALERSDRSDEDLLLGGAIRYPVISEIYLLEGSAGQGRIRHYIIDSDELPIRHSHSRSAFDPYAELDEAGSFFLDRQILSAPAPGGRREVLANLILVIDREYLLDRTGTAVILAFLFSVVTVVIFGVINALILKRTVARPMSRLDAQLNALDVRKLKGFAVDLGERENEFSLIEDSVNLLVQRVQGQFERLQETRDYITRILENASAIIIGIDVNYRIRLVNSAAESLVGAPADDLRYRSWLDLFFEDDIRPLVREQIDGVFSDHSPGLEIQGRVQAGGSGRIVSWRGVKVLDPEGFYQLISFGIDISEQIEAQSQIISLNENLEERVSERTRELMEAVAALEEAKEKADVANLSKARFLSSMSHEIRTPLNAILGMADMLSITDLDRDQKRFVDLFQMAGQELMLLINDILDYSRMDEGRLSIDRAFFSPRNLIRDITIIQAYRAQEKGVQMLYRVDPAVPEEILSDQLRISQILTNLLSNAAKFTESGHIHLSVTFREMPDVEPGDPRSDRCGELQICVSDTGIGIPGEKQQDIFHHFTQGDAGTSRVYGGSGLGLSITRGLVELMDGSISLESEVGRGSSFTVSLPLESRKKYTLSANLLSNMPEGCAVFVADGDPLVRQIYADAFSRDGMSACSDENELSAALRATESAPARLLFLEDAIIHRGIQGDLKRERDRLHLVRNFSYVARVAIDSLLPVESEINKPFSPEDIAQALGAVSNARESDSRFAAGSPDFSSYRLLLVEDSANNQLVIERFLEPTGINLSIASSGAQGVALFESGRYDLVLMDINMPGMDGYEATRRIRQIEQARQGKPAIILALTADAMDTTVNASIEAGCDGHFTKPISRHRLTQVVSQALKGEDLPEPPVAIARGADETMDFPDELSEEFLEMEAIIIEVDPIIKPYAKQYVVDTLGMLDEIRRLHSDGDISAIRNLAHRLKGEGGTYGFDEVSRLGKLMQDACDRDAESEILDLTDQLTRYFHRVEVR